MVKITVKDYPLSKDNNAIETFLQKQGLKLTKSVQYGKIRNPETKELTDCYSGDRIVYYYVKPFQKDIPRTVYIGSTRVRIFYFGQPKVTREMLCTNCFGTDHFRSRCSNASVCKKCRSPNHATGDDKCDAPKDEPYKKVTVFQGKDDVLSNYYMCDINCHGILAKSSEHAYQYVKAIRRGCLDTAKLIKEAPAAYIARQVSKRLPYDPNWKNEKVTVMKGILEEKCKQVPEFREALTNSKSNTLVEAVPGQLFWSSGLNKQDTLNTKKKYWFGQNQMGLLLSEICGSMLQEYQTQSSSNTKKHKPSSHASSSQSQVSRSVNNSDSE